MSTSTVSISANPAARRRPVLDGEKNSNNRELFVLNESNHHPHISSGVGATDKNVNHQSIRGQAVLERSTKDLVQVKKANSTVSPRRSRKVSTKPGKPRWVTVLSVLTKNVGLLLVILGFVQLVRNLALKSRDDLTSTIGFEGRIAEIEGMIKTTASMMQLQVDLVDRKIEQDLRGLKKEVSKQIEDQTMDLEVGLKKLETRTEGVEKSLGEMNTAGLLTKEEFEKVYDKLVTKVKNSESDESNVGLDDLRAYAKDVIQKEIDKHAADGLGRVDYALASSGAAVIKHSEPFAGGKGAGWFPNAKGNTAHRNAVMMLQPSFGEPGQCFALKGSSGFVQIKLRTTIIPEAITLEHAAKSVAYDRSSAPKDSRISGWLASDTKPVGNPKMLLLTEFSYDLEKSNAQTFNLMESARSAIIDTVRFDFSSNHGSPSHTCIYRLRVHGHEPHSVSMMTIESR